MRMGNDNGKWPFEKSAGRDLVSLPPLSFEIGRVLSLHSSHGHQIRSPLDGFSFEQRPSHPFEDLSLPAAGYSMGQCSLVVSQVGLRGNRSDAVRSDASARSVTQRPTLAATSNGRRPMGPCAGARRAFTCRPINQQQHRTRRHTNGQPVHPLDSLAAAPGGRPSIERASSTSVLVRATSD